MAELPRVTGLDNLHERAPDLHKERFISNSRELSSGREVAGDVQDQASWIQGESTPEFV